MNAPLQDPSGIFNVGDLAKPITAFIERVSDAVGGFARPWQIKRVAKAEADAEMIRAQAGVEISELQRRAVQRLIHEEGTRQENMERITVLAIDGIASDAEPERLDSDWLTHFYERGRLISDTEMQALWARLLAGQANSPGRFSRRTVDLLYTMDKSDAQAFEQLCRFNWLFGKDELVPLVLNLSGPETAIYSTAGVTFETLIHLDSIGLITFDAIGEYSLTLPAGEFLTFHWSDKTLVGVEIPRAGAEDDSTFIGVGHALFTRVGKELASLVECDPVDGFCQHVVSKWGEYGYKTMVRVAVRVDESGATSA